MDQKPVNYFLSGSRVRTLQAATRGTFRQDSLVSTDRGQGIAEMLMCSGLSRTLVYRCIEGEAYDFAIPSNLAELARMVVKTVKYVWDVVTLRCRLTLEHLMDVFNVHFHVID